MIRMELTALSCEGVAGCGPLLSLNGCFAVVGAGSSRWGMLLRSCPPGLACGQPLLLYFAPQHAPPARSSAPWSTFPVDKRPGMPPRESGGQRSEVKEEGRAQPGPGDMSGGGHPVALARSVFAGKLQPNVRIGPKADAHIHTDVSCVAAGARRHGLLK